jgi:hypothetical protein
MGTIFIIQLKEWLTTFGRWNPVEHKVRKQQCSRRASGRKIEAIGAVGTPGRSASPHLEAPGALLSLVSCSFSSMCPAPEFIAQKFQQTPRKF